MKLFISYARSNHAEIKALAKSLQKYGHEAWFDFRLLPGQDWKHILTNQIKAADAFVYAMSTYSLNSEWCRWELSQAQQYKKPILPLTLHEVTIPRELAHLHCVSIDEHNRILGGLASLSACGLGHSAPSFVTSSSPKGLPSRANWDSIERAPTPHLHIRKNTIAARLSGENKAPSKAVSRDEYIIGIDFGTSNSLCSIWVDDGPKLVPNRYGSYSTPSAVYIRNDHTTLVGEAAVSSILKDPQHGVLQVKRLFGLEAQLEAYGKLWTAAELAAKVLESLARDAEAFQGETSKSIIVTAPAYFTEAQLDDLRQACELAGLKLARIIAEPTAASLAFGYRGAEEQTVAVVDLGGGTFDISILEVGDEVFEVLAISGESDLGGTDYDDALVDYCLTCFREQTGVDLSQNFGARMRIRESAEKAKIELTTTKATYVFVPFFYADASGALDLSVRITRDQFNTLTEHLTARIIECCEEATHLCLSGPDIDRVLLVGLPSRTPMVAERVANFFQKNPSIGLNPETCVAEGAAIQGAVLMGKFRGALLLDVTSHHLGLEVDGGVNFIMIEASTTIPWKTQKKSFGLVSDQQTHVELRILQGGHTKAEENLLLSSIILDLGDNSPNEPIIEVIFEVGVSHQIDVTAKLINTNQSRKVNLLKPVFEKLPDSAIGGTLRRKEMDLRSIPRIEGPSASHRLRHINKKLS